jgi:hypothetical protein
MFSGILGNEQPKPQYRHVRTPHPGDSEPIFSYGSHVPFPSNKCDIIARTANIPPNAVPNAPAPSTMNFILSFRNELKAD